MAIALTLAGLLVAGGTAAQLLHAAPRQSGSNDIAPQQFSVTAPARAGVCQEGETLFAGTGSLVMTIAAFGEPTPELDVRVRAGRRTLARGSLPAGWDEGVVGVPLAPAAAGSTSGVTVCVRARGGAQGRLAFGGEPTDPAVGARVRGRPQGGRVSIVSLRTGRPSLLAMGGDIVKRYERGNARWLGGWTWIVMIVLVVAGLVAAGAALVVSGRSERRIPPAARCAAAAAVAFAAAWALLIPPFMVPDEISHVAYVQGLVETGELPLDRPGVPPYSVREQELLTALDFYDVIGDTTAKPAWTAQEEAAVRIAERSKASRASTSAATASANPPLYYLAQAPIYAAARGASMLDQLLPMRLLSVLLGGLTVLFTFFFLRELLPGSPVVWPVGAVAVAAQPLFGFVTAGVNADAGMFACGAATFWLMVVVLRRGLTLRRALALGGVLAAGLLTKPLFLGLVPAGLLALVIAALRLDAPWRRRGQLAGAGLAVALIPVLAYHVLGGALSDHPYFPDGVKVTAAAVGGTAGAPTGLAGLRAEASYIWQLYLPRLGFMLDYFRGTLPLRVTWFDGFFGRLGWLDYAFPMWVTDLAVKVAFAVIALVAAAFVRARRRLRARWPELLCCGLAFAGILGSIGVQQYNAFLTRAPALTQARYLLPALALYGALIALAAHGLGRRAAPYLGVALLALAALHEIAAMILTVTRYYA